MNPVVCIDARLKIYSRHDHLGGPRTKLQSDQLLSAEEVEAFRVAPEKFLNEKTDPSEE